MQDRDICRTCMPSRMISYAHTYIPLPTPCDRPDALSASVHNVWRWRLQLPHYPALFLPTHSSRTSMAVLSVSYADNYTRLSMGVHVCMYACMCRGMYVCKSRDCSIFAACIGVESPKRPRPCFRRQSRMDIIAGDDFTMTFCSPDLT